jgi:HAD superfamily hydrolase (TIGR01484 family)
MICLDIDGTLINSKHIITEKTKEVIRIAANQKNIPVILVSARPPQGIFHLQKDLGIEQPIICYSGALVLDGDDILLDKNIKMPDVLMVYSMVKELGVHASLYKGS